MFDICKENGWNYIIRYKEGSIPTIMDEYERIPEKRNGNSKKGKYEFVNGIGYKKHEVNVLKYCRVICMAYPTSELSIAKEVVNGKIKDKKLSTKF